MKAVPYRLAVLALLALHALLLVLLAATTPWTTDEPNYLQAGIALRKELRWDVLATVLHGPLTFYGNQVAAWLGVDYADWESAKFAARAGMLPWALLCAGMVAALARRTLGERGALCALAVHVLNPIVLSHGCLITSDMALAASSLLLTWLLWIWIERRGVLGAALAGAGLGIALATKYLAVLLVPIVVAVAGVAAAPAGTRWLPRLARGVLALALVASVGLLTLHATYLFRAGGYEVLPAVAQPDPTDERAGPLSAALRGFAELRGAPTLLGLVPAPFVRGLDYQMHVGSVSGSAVLGERSGPGFASYYAIAIATKVPLAFLALALLGCVLRGSRVVKGLALLCAAVALVPFAYLSGFAKLQLGVRYAIPSVALLALPAGRGLAALLAGKWTRILGGAAGLALVAFLVTSWPRVLGAFNVLAGPRPWLLFADSNVDWRVDFLPDRDEAALRARWPGAVRVHAKGGPRLGRVLAHAQDLAPADPERPGRVYHWLRRYVPTDREGAWLLFDLREADLRATAAADPRARAELAVALVALTMHNAAREALGEERGGLADVARELIEIAFQGRTQEGPMMRAFVRAGRSDLVDPKNELAPLAVRLEALFLEKRFADAIALVEQVRATRPLALDEALFAAAIFDGEGKPEAALACLDAAAPPRDHSLWPAFAELRMAYERQAKAIRAILARGSGRFTR